MKWAFVPTLSMAGLVELARPCSISGAVKVDTSSDRPQFLNAKVPVADSSREVGLMMLDILMWPAKMWEVDLIQPVPIGWKWRWAVKCLYPYRKHLLEPLQCPPAETTPLPPAEGPLEPPTLQLMWQMCCSSCTHSKDAPEDVTQRGQTHPHNTHVCIKHTVCSSFEVVFLLPYCGVLLLYARCLFLRNSKLYAILLWNNSAVLSKMPGQTEKPFPGKDAVLHWPMIRLSWPISPAASCSPSLPYHNRLYSDLRAVLLLGLCSSGSKETVTQFVVRY